VSSGQQSIDMSADASICIVEALSDAVMATTVADAPSGAATPADVTGAGFGAEPIHPGTDLDLDRVTRQDCEAAGFL